MPKKREEKNGVSRPKKNLRQPAGSRKMGASIKGVSMVKGLTPPGGPRGMVELGDKVGTRWPACMCLLNVINYLTLGLPIKNKFFLLQKGRASQEHGMEKKARLKAKKGAGCGCRGAAAKACGVRSSSGAASNPATPPHMACHRTLPCRTLLVCNIAQQGIMLCTKARGAQPPHEASEVPRHCSGPYHSLHIIIILFLYIGQ
jgi:hypothetical protein